MPTLEWIGKNKVIAHHTQVPYRLLDKKYTFNATESDNKIIKGDNLEALKALLPQYEGRVKCIYIDPPYNTGNENWVYNDNVNDPKIKKWLGQVVGKEGEDLSRHDKWLCMMYPRLKLLQKLLKSDGFLIISISYHELQYLLLLCKEIFATAQVVAVTVQTSGGKPSGGFNFLHEYIVFVVPIEFNANPIDFCGGNDRTPFEGLTLSTFDKTQRPNQVYPIFIDIKTTRLFGTGESLQTKIKNGTYTGKKENYEYDFSIAPEGTVAVWPITNKGKDCVWRQIPDRLESDWKKGYIKISPNKDKKSMNRYSIQYLPSGVIEKIEKNEIMILGQEENAPTLKLGDNQTVGSQIPTIWSEKSFFTVNGTQLLSEVFSEKTKVFDYPKSIDLISSIIQATTKKNDIILDSFAGSGTTAHAVLNLNKQDGGNRTFILVEMEDYAETITAERVRRVISGYGDTAGTGGDFSFYELGETLMVDGNLNCNVATERIREYIWYTETKTNLPKEEKKHPYYLGDSNNVAYYFYYEKEKHTTLDHDFLATITKKSEAYLMYADSCSLSSDELDKYNITFKKIPRDITRL